MAVQVKNTLDFHMTQMNCFHLKVASTIACENNRAEDRIRKSVNDSDAMKLCTEEANPAEAVTDGMQEGR